MASQPQFSASKALLTDLSLFTGGQEETAFEGQAIALKGDRIEAILPQAQALERFSDYPQKSLQGALVAPGFIDLQINGCGGVLLNESPTLETLEIMDQTNRRFGVTSFLPTLITSPAPRRMEAYQALKQAQAQQGGKAVFLGLHLEGPCLNAQKKGAHPEAHLLPLDQGLVDEFIQHEDQIRLMTLAPECSDSAFIERLASSSIHLSIGHSQASFEQANKAFSQGVSLCTHLFNASAAMGPREGGWPSAVMTSKQVYAGFIADGFHVHPAMSQIAKTMLQDRLFFVTDAMPPAGTDLTTFNLEGTTVHNKDGRLCFEDGTLAGSSSTMISCIRHAREVLGFSLYEALRSVSRYPAEAIGLSAGHGRLIEGGIAHLAVLQDDPASGLKVQTTFRNAQEAV